MPKQPDPLGHVSRETLARLETLAALTQKWTRKINLIAPTSAQDLWQRHIVDSAQIWAHRPEAAKTWVDIGSGGGVPGLVIAALAAEQAPDIHITLIESDSRKCVFLRQAAREVGLEITVLNQRIEDTEPQKADVLSARALAQVHKIFELTKRFTDLSTAFILPKGKSVDAELDRARESWSFELYQHYSITDGQARVLVLTDVHPKE